MKQLGQKSNHKKTNHVQKKIERMREILFPQSHTPLSVYKVDYHFHPNLPNEEAAALNKCKNWWQELQSKGINVVIITEHVYKNPKRAFQMMQATKPKGCYIFPGMEFLTSEGIDIIIFSKTQKIYHYAQLKPYYLTMSQTLDFVSEHQIKAFITHPHTLGNTSIIKKTTSLDYAKYVNRIKSLEVTNTAFNQLLYLLDKPVLRQIFAQKIQQILNTRKVPIANYPNDIQLITAGSDAHNLGEVGTHVLISTTQKNIFATIASNARPIIVENYTRKINGLLFFFSTMTCFSEAWIKFQIRILAMLKQP